jgi:hypothetical protein
LDSKWEKEEEERHKRVREIVADGAKTEFWGEVCRMLEDLKEQALESLKGADPGNVSRVAQLQQMYKIPDLIINLVDSLAEEQAMIDEKLKKESDLI